MRKLLFLSFFTLLSAGLAFSQTTSGRLLGTVSSPDGVLPGATVTAKDNSTGKSFTAVTKGDGTYSFQQLEFGTYVVTVTAQGFKTHVSNGVKVDVGRDYSLDVTLELGSVQESVTVTAGADVVTSTTGQVSNTVSPEQILNLPLITRNPLSLAGLQAGVSANSAQNTTINGMRTTFTNITRDGINIQDTFIRANATDFVPGRPSVDDTGEFSIVTTNQEADQGMGGAQIRLVTPRGTKDFHGALFAFNRNSGFGANSFFNNRSTNPAVNSKPSFRNRNQFGGKLSGPLPLPGFGEGTPAFYKNKGFFFFAYEGIRDPLSRAETRTIMTPTARAGQFQYTRATPGAAINTNIGTATVTCPATAAANTGTCVVSDLLGFARSSLSNLTIPATISPLIQSRIISLLPTASNFTGGDGLNTAGYRLLRRQDQTRNTYSSRIDVDFDESNSLLGIFNYNKESNLRPDADLNSYTSIPGVIQFSANKQFTMAYRHVFAPNIVNEVRGGLFASEVPFDRTAEIPGFLLANLLITNPETGFLDQGRTTKAFNFQDNVDWVVGNHTIKFGGQLQFFKVNAYNDAAIVETVNVAAGNGTPSLSAASFPGGIGTTQLGTANNLMALLGGLYNQATQSFNVVDVSRGFELTRQFQPFRFENHSLFVADRWQAMRGLTLSLGVRYELFPALRIENGIALEPVVNGGNVLASILDPNGKYNVVGTNAGKANNYYKTDMDNFAPSLSVAWSPNFESGIAKFLFGTSGKSVIRAGYSQAYGNDSIVTSISNADAGNVGLGRTANTLVSLNGRLDSGVPAIAPPTFITPPRTYLQNNALGVGNFFGTVFAVDPNIKTPKVEQYSLGYQREFGGNTAFEIRYVGSRGDNFARSVDFNQINIAAGGYLTDFERARANYALDLTARGAALATPFCSGITVGCVPLSVFQDGGAVTQGRLRIGISGGVSLGTFINNLTGGTPADLALSLINNTANINNQPSSANPAAIPNVAFLANPATGVANIMMNDGAFQFNSLQVEVRRRLSHGLFFQANYTFSKNLTNAVGVGQLLVEPYLDNNNKALDYSRADFDQTHVFNFNGIYSLPFGKGKSFLNKGGAMDKIFGGWEISALANWSSGAPITIVDTRGTLNRAGRSGRQTPLSNLTNSQIQALSGIFERNGNIYFIDPSVIGASGAASNGFGTTPFSGQAFFNTNPGQTGNIGRAIFNGPKFFNISAALLKSIRFGETIRLQLRMEAFNVLNNTNFVQNAQFPNIASTTFGQITATANAVTTNGAREIQFAFRFEF